MKKTNYQIYIKRNRLFRKPRYTNVMDIDLDTKTATECISVLGNGEAILTPRGHKIDEFRTDAKMLYRV